MVGGWVVINASDIELWRVQSLIQPGKWRYRLSFAIDGSRPEAVRVRERDCV